METYGPKLEKAIRDYMAENEINATGQTSSSVSSGVFETSSSIVLAIGGSKAFTVLQTGRRLQIKGM